MLNDKEEGAFRVFMEELSPGSQRWDDNLHCEIYTTLYEYRIAFKKAIDSLDRNKHDYGNIEAHVITGNMEVLGSRWCKTCQSNKCVLD